MFHKKKLTPVEQKNEKKMYSARPNVKWLTYMVLAALIGSVLLMTLANVQSRIYYRNLKASSEAVDPKSSTTTRSIPSFDEISSRAVSCSTSYCTVTCSGDMTDLNTYLKNVKSCQTMKLTITDCTFPDDRLKSDWLEGSYNIVCINITRATLTGIDSGAFDQSTVSDMTELKLNGVQLAVLTENTFVGLGAVDTFTLVNQVEVFSGDGFLKPMANKLKSLTIKHVTSTATDPTPWLLGDFPKLMSVNFAYSNLGGYITLDTFQHLKQLQILSLSWCKISYLPDGIFDFMIGSLGVYIFVDNNELKRLAGDYLTKVKPNSLKYVQIEKNPRDCTCELEQLITEYTRYPGGFGTPAECSTPSQHAGKALNQIVVEPCEDTTTALTTTPSATTPTATDTTTLSTVATTTGTTEPPSDTTPDSITSPATTTLNTTTTDIPTPSTLSSSTTGTTEPSTEPSPEPSTEPPPYTTPDPITSPVTTTPSSTNPTEPPSSTVSTTEDEMISSSPQTTPSPQNETTTMSPDKIVSIECKRGSVNPSESVCLLVELARPDTQFNITSLTETSAQMTMEETADDLAVIWFHDQLVIDDTGGNVRIVGDFKVGCQSDLEKSLLIEGLSQTRTYTFCLVKEGVQLISPFNCLPYYPSDGSKDLYEVWLMREDKALMIGLFVLAIVISVCIGAVGMFLSLRVHPVLLKGSKRVIVVNRSTGDVPYMPRPRSKSAVTDSSNKNGFKANTTIRQRRSSETSSQSGRSYMMAHNYEDIDYQSNMSVMNDMIYANRIPKSPAPPLPKRVSQDTSLTKKNVNKIEVAVVYQKENYYEDI